MFASVLVDFGGGRCNKSRETD